MELTNQQAMARQEIFRWFRSGDSDFFLAGWAGTGKTTLIKHLVEEARGYVVVLALTNKAVKVLRDKGIPSAETIHRFLYRGGKSGACSCKTENNPYPVYHAKGCGARKLHFSRDPFDEEDFIPPSLIIVDEASMVPERLATDILSKGIPVLAVGDPFQLPPVEGKPYWTQPNFTLTDIQRQAKDNPIIQLATAIRTGGRILPGTYGETIVSPHSLMRSPELELDDWDQILTVGSPGTELEFAL